MLKSQHVENDLKVYSVFFAVVAKEVNECFCNFKQRILFRHKVDTGRCFIKKGDIYKLVNY